jgi:hypothetical protein
MWEIYDLLVNAISILLCMRFAINEAKNADQLLKEIKLR